MVAVFLSGCGSLTVLDPQGPVAEQQSSLIWLSIWFMIFIVLVVFVLLTIMLVKYRDRGNNDNYDLQLKEVTNLNLSGPLFQLLL